MNWLIEINGQPSVECREKEMAKLIFKFVKVFRDKSAQMIDKERVERLNQ